MLQLTYIKNLKTQSSVIRLACIAQLFQQLAFMLAAGIPLLRTFDILIQGQQHLPLQKILQEIRQEILSGKTLSYCFRQHPKHFNPFICQLIKIGEHTGQLDQVLAKLVRHQAQELALRNKIKRTLFYPLFIFIIVCLMLIALLLFVIPHFAEIFANSHMSLPLLTRLIFYLSYILKHYFFIIVIFFGSLSYFIWIKRQAVLLFLKTHLMHLPVLTHFLDQLFLLQITQHLALTLAAGMPLLEAIQLSQPLALGPRYLARIESLSQKLNAGLRLHQAMENNFPIALIQMIKTGEETGNLADILNQSAKNYENAIHTTFDRFQQLLEPLIMLGLGVLIGGLVIGMYLPIFKLGTTL